MARDVTHERVTARLDADESSGYALARFVLGRGDRLTLPTGEVLRGTEYGRTVVIERLSAPGGPAYLVRCLDEPGPDPYARKWIA